MIEIMNNHPTLCTIIGALQIFIDLGLLALGCYAAYILLSKDDEWSDNKDY